MVAVRNEVAAPVDVTVSEPTPIERWNELGQRLLSRGSLHLATALESAQGVTAGLALVDDAKEDAISTWFVGLFHELLARGGHEAVNAAWMVMVEDQNAFKTHGRYGDIADVTDSLWLKDGELAEEQWRDLLASADRYARVVLARCDALDIEEIETIIAATAGKHSRLDEYAPFENPQGDDNGLETMNEAVLAMTRKQHTKCVSDFAYACAMNVDENGLTHPFRIGLIAWLTYRGLKKPRARHLAAVGGVA